jgi:predicted metal-dependent peptidase
MIMADKQALRHLRNALRDMVRKYPFHAYLLALASFEEDRSIETMAVLFCDRRYRYKYNPVFICQCTPEERMGVIHHEINHVLFGHVIAKPEDFPNVKAKLIAEEVTVNEWVCEPLPGHPLTLEQFPYLPAGEDTYKRYERLAARDDLPDLKPLDDHQVWHLGAGNFGNLHPNDPAAMRRLRLMAAAGKNPQARDQLVAEIMRRFPGDGRVEQVPAEGPTAAPINWRRVLESTQRRPRHRDATYKRPPRRLPHMLGILPGYRMQPGPLTIVAVVDTSGSMNGPTLATIKGELSKLNRVGKVTVVECDNHIRAKYPYRGVFRHVHGRGGTSFCPPLATSFLDPLRPDVVVYFTDGDGLAPEHPPRVPVIWSLCHGGKRPAPWGRVVRLER